MPELKIKELPSLLGTHFNDQVEVLEERSEFLTPPGEHYGSIMLKLDLLVKLAKKEEPQTLHLVAKMPPASEMLKKCFDIGVTFKKELESYMVMIPTLIDFQREYNVSEDRILNIFPECYGGRINLDGSDTVDDDALLLFENLKVQGYDTGDRFKGFDLEHAKLIVQDLAKFHAVPIALRILKPNKFKEAVTPCIVPNSGIEVLPEDVAGAFYDSVVEVSKTIPELEPYWKTIEERMQVASKNAENGRNDSKPPPNPVYATAVHSDYWVNNTMVQWDDKGKPIRNKIVDLQIMQYDSAPCDLLFFLFTSVQNDVLDEHYDALVQLYYDTFIDYLKDFKVDLEPFNWPDFLKELEKCIEAEFYHIAFMLKPIFTEKGKINNLADFQPSDWGRRDLLGEAHRQKLKDTMLAFAKRNWL